MAEDVSEETLTGGLSLLVNLSRALLQKAQQDAEASLENFVPYKITTLFGLITAGANFYKSVAAVREQVEELLQLEVYRSFGLGSSYTKVMRFGCLLQYGEYGAVDRDFPDVPPHLLEDIYQMGGDFLLDEAGNVLLSHRPKNPLDRPTVQLILQAAEPAGGADSA
eukprot:superscaffoldBa00004860_g19545